MKVIVIVLSLLALMACTSFTAEKVDIKRSDGTYIKMTKAQFYNQKEIDAIFKCRRDPRQ